MDNKVNSKRKIIKTVCSIAAFILGFIVYIFFSFLLTPHDLYMKTSQGAVAKSLLQSLQTSAAIYVAQQKYVPTAFSNFVAPGGAATGAMTLTIENVIKQLKDEKLPFVPEKPHGAFTLNFSEGGKAVYYLNGSDVTATYKGFSDQ